MDVRHASSSGEGVSCARQWAATIKIKLAAMNE
jgi:hypothetical protein